MDGKKRGKSILYLLLWFILRRWHSLEQVASDERMIGERWIGKDLKWNGHGLIEVLPQNLHGKDEEDQEKPMSGKQGCRSDFEPRIFQIQAQRVTASPTCSVVIYIVGHIMYACIYSECDVFESRVGDWPRDWWLSFCWCDWSDMPWLLPSRFIIILWQPGRCYVARHWL